jgi:vitamin B12 transporter
MFKRLLLSLPLLLAASPVLAQTPSYALPEIVVTASKWQEDTTQVPQSMTVITRQEIEQRGTPFVLDLLQTRSELQVVQHGGVGKTASFFLRGGNSRQILVLVDGVKVNSPSTGAADLSGLLSDDIERIEIIKGPQSTLYGSEAMAGVIHIITRKGSGRPRTDLHVEAGSFDTYKASAGFSGGTSDANYRLTATWFDTDGISVAKNGVEEDGYTNTSLSARFGVNPSTHTSLDLSLRYTHDRSELDDFEFGVGMVDALHFIQKRDDYLAALTGAVFLHDNYEQRLSLSLAGQRLRSEDPDTPWNNARIDVDSQLIDWQHLVEYAPLTFTGGLSYRREAADIRDAFDESTDNKAAYLNAKFRLLQAALILDAGLRYDDHETFGDHVTYRTGLLYHLTSAGMRFKVNHGTGFRAPSLNELFWPFFGNPELQAEKSRAWDIGVEKDLLDQRLMLEATWFYQRYRNLIQTNFDTFTADNIGRARIEGVELAATARPAQTLALKIAYTWLDAIDLDTDERLTLRPRSKLVTSLDYLPGPWSLGIDHSYQSKRFDASAQRSLGAYSLVNLRLAYDVNRHVRLFARAENLFDKDYEAVAGYGTPGLAVYGGARVTF